MEQQTRELMEEKLIGLLKGIDKMDDKQRNAAVTDIRALASALNEANSTELEAFDKQEKRRIDENKNQSLAEIEMAKTKFDWKKASLELVKIIGPSLISVYAYNLFQKRVLHFEEFGRIVSTAGRELHLPRIFK